MNVAWIKQHTAVNTTEDDFAPTIAVDLNGNIYVTYLTSYGTVSGGTHTGGFDIVVFKMDTNGNVVWIKQNAIMNTVDDDANPIIAVDGAGNVYVSYQSYGTVSSGTLLGNNDIIVFKMDTEGNIIWIKEQSVMNTIEDDLYSKIAVDTNGNVYVSYWTYGTVSGGVNAAGVYSIVVFKMDTNGNLVWIKQQDIMNTTGYNGPSTITVDVNSNVYVTYYADGTVSSGTNSGNLDIVVIKMDTNGNVVWIKQNAMMNTTSDEYNSVIAVDASGNIYISYQTFGTVSSEINSGSTDIVVFKMDTNGNVMWIKEQATMNTAGSDIAPTIAIDVNRNIYVSYFTDGTASDGINIGGFDIVVFKMDTNGNVVWIEQQAVMNTLDNDASQTVAVDTNGNVYVAYHTYGTVSSGLNSGNSDIVVLKMIPASNMPASGSVTISGNLIDGSMLTSSNTIVDANGLGAFNYQWSSSSSPTGLYTNITGATSSAYILSYDDIGKYVRLTITFTDLDGFAEGPITSSPYGPVSARPSAISRDIEFISYTANSITLSWTAPTSVTPDSYIVRAQPGNITTTTTSTTATLTTVPGVSYYITVIPVFTGKSTLYNNNASYNEGDVILYTNDSYYFRSKYVTGTSPGYNLALNPYSFTETASTTANVAKFSFDPAKYYWNATSGQFPITNSNYDCAISVVVSRFEIAIEMSWAIIYNQGVRFNFNGWAFIQQGPQWGAACWLVNPSGVTVATFPTGIALGNLGFVRRSNGFQFYTYSADRSTITQLYDSGNITFTNTSTNIVLSPTYRTPIHALYSWREYNLSLWTYIATYYTTIISPPAAPPVPLTTDVVPWLWYDAADPTSVRCDSSGALTEWYNKGTSAGSTNGNVSITGTVSYGSTTMNSAPIMRFNASSKLTTPSIIATSQSFSFFAVFKPTYASISTTVNSLIMPNITSNGGPIVRINGTASNTIGLANSGYPWCVVGPQSFSQNTTILLSSQASATLTNNIIAINGTSIALSTNSASGNVNTIIGSTYNINNEGVTQDFGEIIMYMGNITATNRMRIEGYLAWKWGLQADLPSSHPYSIVNVSATMGLYNRRRLYTSTVSSSAASINYVNTRGLTTDSFGNIYLSDTDTNSRIIKITADGISSVYISGIKADDMFVDKSTNILYIANRTGNSIQTTTVPTYTSLTTIVSVPNPICMALDTNKNIYVFDFVNRVLYRSTPTGSVSTVGSGWGQVVGIVFDSSNNMYVSEFAERRIRKRTPAGVVTVLAGSGSLGSTDGIGTDATFSSPGGITIDPSNNIYVADFGNNKIRMITPAGVVTTIAGTGTRATVDGLDTTSQLNGCHYVSWHTDGSLYVSDRNGGTVRKLSLGPLNQTGTIALGGISSVYQSVNDLNGNMYVGSYSSNFITRVSSTGTISTFVGSSLGSANGAGTAATFTTTTGVIKDELNNLYIGEYGGNRIRKVTPAGLVTTFVASIPTPLGLTMGPDGYIYVATHANQTIRRVSRLGTVTIYAGTGAIGAADNVNRLSATFNYPCHTAFDASGVMYIADINNNRIRKIQNNIVTTFAGSGAATDADGTGTGASIHGPHSMAFDQGGNMYVLEYSGQTVRKITPAGVVTTVAGAYNQIGAGDNVGTAARFSYPTYCRIDENENLWISDNGNNRIRHIAINRPVVGSITISGTTILGNTLTSDTSALVDYDIIGAFSYAWSASPTISGTFTPIVGAINSTYTITNSDVGKYIKLTVSYTDSRGSLESVSAITNTIVTLVPPGASPGVSATAGSSSAFVYWALPNNNGTTIDSYIINVITNGTIIKQQTVLGESTLSAVIYGLKNGTSYTFTVISSNSIGNSPASVASLPVTPVSNIPTTYYSLAWIKDIPILNTTASESAPFIATDTGGNIYLAYLTSGTISGGTALNATNNITFAKVNSGGALVWVKQYAALNNTSSALRPSIAVDNSGNIYTSYHVGASISGQNPIPIGSYDVVVAKLDTNGNMLWTLQNAISTTSSDSNSAIALDISGNVYVAYSTTGTVSSGSNSGNSDIVVLKVNSGGLLQWIKQNVLINTTGNEFYPSITSDNSGNSYVMYQTSNSVSGGIFMGGTSDIAIAKFNTNGNLQWVKHYASLNTAGTESSPTITSDATGNVYITYTATGTVSGGTNVGSTDTVVAKIDTHGNIQWIQQNADTNTSNADSIPKIAIDPSGNVVIAYYTSGTISGGINSGGSDIVMYSLAGIDGTFQWTQQHSVVNTSGNDLNPSIAIDSQFNIVVAYETNGTISGGVNLGSNDIVVYKRSAVAPISPSITVIDSPAFFGARILWENQGYTYNIYRSTTSAGTSKTLVGTVTNAGIFDDATLSSFGTYYYFITATNGPNTSAFTTGTSYVFREALNWLLQSPTLNTNATESNPAIAIDPSGNICMAYMRSSGGYNDIVLAKVNSGGVVQWVTQDSRMNTTLDESNPTIATDGSGNMYIAYVSTGTVSGGVSSGSYDIVIAKTNSSGVIQWMKQYTELNTPSNEQNPYITTDIYGNVYIAYQTEGALTGGTNVGSTDIVITKLSTNGSILWSKQSMFNTSATDYIPMIVTDNDGNIYGGVESAGSLVNQNMGARDIVVFKLDTYGNLVWLRKPSIVNTTSDDYRPSVCFDQAGSIYVAYTSTGTVSGGTSRGQADIVVAKMDINGTVVWLKQYATINSIANEGDLFMRNDSYGNVYLTYTTSGTISGGIFNSVYDVCIVKIDSNGQLVWSKQASSMNTLSPEYAPCSAVDGFGNIYVAYYSVTPVSGGTFMGGSGDIVLAKITQPIVTATVPSAPAITIQQSYTDVIVRWEPVNNANNAVITSYTIRVEPIGITISVNGSLYNTTIKNIPLGHLYTFSVYATNVVGNGATTTYSGMVYGLPAAPVNVTATYGNGLAIVSWAQSLVLNQGDIIGYRVIANPGGSSVDVGSDTFTTIITGLANGTAYTFTVTALCGYADSNPSLPSNSVTPSTIPEKPLSATAIAWTYFGSMYVSWTPGFNGGAPVFYIVLCNETGIAYQTTKTNIVFSDLDVRKTYTFIIYAVNQNGTSAPSSATSHVYPSRDTFALEWIRQSSTINTSSGDENPSIAVTSDGNIYLTYRTLSVVSGGVNTGGSYDVVVVKLNTYGNILWIKQQQNMNTFANEISPTISCDSNGNVYVAYYTYGTVVGETNTGNSDIVVFKMDANGNLLWIRQRASMNTAGTDLDPTIATDINGNVYVSYYTNGTVSGGTNSGGNNIVVFKLDTNGNTLWIRQQAAMNSSGNELYPKLASDNNGNLYVSYYTDGTVSGGTNRGSYDIVVFKMDTNGSLVWIKEHAVMNTTAGDQTPTIAIDANGNIYVSYETTGVVSGGIITGSYEVVVMKMDTNGDVLWITQNPSINTSASDQYPCVTIDIYGNVYVVYQTVGVLNGSNIGGTDIAVVKLDTNGNLVWAKQHFSFNTSANDSNPSIGVDATGSLYVAYNTTGSLIDGTNIGNSDIVVFKMSEVDISNVILTNNIVIPGGNIILRAQNTPRITGA